MTAATTTRDPLRWERVAGQDLDCESQVHVGGDRPQAEVRLHFGGRFVETLDLCARCADGEVENR